jgi:hypothetical protein
MRRPLQIVVFAVAMLFVHSALAQVLKAAGNEAFCRDKADFPEYLAVVNNKQFSYHTVKGCMELRKGNRYRVIEEHPDGIDEIHLYPPQGPVDGYILGQTNK